MGVAKGLCWAGLDSTRRGEAREMEERGWIVASLSM